MSIIEKALMRQRAMAGVQFQKTEPSAASPSGAAAPDRSKAPQQTETRAVLTLDETALQQVGLSPPDEVRHRHIHEYRVIKRALLDAARPAADKGAGSAGSLIMITSALAGEGKTYTSFNLARSIALELDRRVVLVDADIPKRDLSRSLGVDGEPGLLDLLRDEHLTPESVLIPTSLGVDFLPVGRADERANELISSQRMAQVATLLRNRGTVVFDSAPMLLTSEAPSLVRLASQVVVVVRASVTPEDAVRDVLHRIGSAKPVSVVLNGWTPSGMLEKQYQLGYYYDGGAAPPGARKG